MKFIERLRYSKSNGAFFYMAGSIKVNIFEYAVVRYYLFKLKKRCQNGIGNYLPNAKIEDLAASIQSVLEECILKIIINVY